MTFIPVIFIPVAFLLSSITGKSQDIDKIKQFADTSASIRLQLIRSVKKPFKFNFCYDTTYKLVSGCDQAKCIIGDIRAKSDSTITTACSIIRSRKIVNMLCIVVKLKPGLYFLSFNHFNRNAPESIPFDTPRWGEIHDYILDVSGGKIRIAEERHLIAM